MDIFEHLISIVEKGFLKYRTVNLVDSQERVYILSMSYSDGVFDIGHVYIAPRQQGGFKHFITLLKSLKGYGVKKIVLSKVVNSHLAQHLFDTGWTLKASKKGNWIDFHLDL